MKNDELTIYTYRNWRTDHIVGQYRCRNVREADQLLLKDTGLMASTSKEVGCSWDLEED